MGSKSGYLARQEQSKNNLIHAVEDMTRQFMIDTLILTMNKRKYGYGYDRAMQLMADWEQTRMECRKALDPKDPEADVVQEHMDRAMARIIRGKQELIPFYDRYPCLKRIKY